MLNLIVCIAESVLVWVVEVVWECIAPVGMVSKFACGLINRAGRNRAFEDDNVLPMSNLLFDLALTC